LWIGLNCDHAAHSHLSSPRPRFTLTLFPSWCPGFEVRSGTVPMSVFSFRGLQLHPKPDHLVDSFLLQESLSTTGSTSFHFIQVRAVMSKQSYTSGRISPSALSAVLRIRGIFVRIRTHGSGSVFIFSADPDPCYLDFFVF